VTAADCPRIHIQLWSARRIATTTLILAGGALFGLLLFDNLNSANFS
jgi:hypothetical protein